MIFFLPLDSTKDLTSKPLSGRFFSCFGFKFYPQNVISKIYYQCGKSSELDSERLGIFWGLCALQAVDCTRINIVFSRMRM